jgi:phosphoribosylformimino-5-aminoimidazole carboxamide ribonucleotide (ProFAR) isomerase
MLIPSIDLQNGHVVQLVQGEKLAIEAPDPSRGSNGSRAFLACN